MTTFAATFFDGKFARGQTATVQIVDDGTWEITTPDGARRVQQAELHISARLASVPRWIGLPEGSWLETDANDEIDAALSGGTRTRGGVVHWLESKAAIAAAATLLVVAITVAALHFGLPRLAQRVAAAVPADIDQKLGQTTLASLHAIGASPSQLSSAQRENVQRQLARIVRNESMPDLHFRHFGTLPNAFALPGNIIVVTDALVTMAEDEEEIAAVLAHELGHLRAHHPVQRLLLGSTALLVLTAATGDLSTLTSFAATLPFLLLQNGYSREFESAADTFAAERLLEAGIDPARLAAILMRMDKTHDDFVSRRFTYLSTHPATEDRVQKLRGPADE